MCHLQTKPIESGPQEEILKSQCNSPENWFPYRHHSNKRMQNNNSLRIQRIQGKYRLTGRNKQVSGNRTNTEQLWQMV